LFVRRNLSSKHRGSKANLSSLTKSDQETSDGGKERGGGPKVWLLSLTGLELNIRGSPKRLLPICGGAVPKLSVGSWGFPGFSKRGEISRRP